MEEHHANPSRTRVYPFAARRHIAGHWLAAAARFSSSIARRPDVRPQRPTGIRDRASFDW